MKVRKGGTAMKDNSREIKKGGICVEQGVYMGSAEGDRVEERVREK